MAEDTSGGDDQDETTSASWAELRTQREAALRELSRQSAEANAVALTREPLRRPSLAPRRVPGRGRSSILLLAALAALVVLVSTGAVVLRTRLQPSVPPRPTLAIRPVTIVSDAGGLGCALGAAWSPDGTRIAVLGYQNGGGGSNPCPNYMLQPDGFYYVYWAGQVNVYDATSGKLLHTIPLDAAVDRELGLHPPATIKPLSHAAGGSGDVGAIVSYSRFTWSADSQTLAVTFTVPQVTNIHLDQNGGGSYGSTDVAEGVLRVAVQAGGSADVLARRNVSTQDVPPGTWDFTSGRLKPYAQTLGGYSYPAPALDYAWTTDGTVTPHWLLSSQPYTASVPVEPVGDQHGAHFGVWQPATVAPVYTSGTGGASMRVPGAFWFTADVMAWLPDGRYLTRFPVNAALETNTAAQSYVLPSNGPQGTPLLPVRDAGLRAALAAADKRRGFGNDQSAQNVEIAWRPDGRVLAVLAARVAGAPIYGSPQLAYDVTLYDCATGHELGVFTVALPGSPNSVNGFTPDGQSFAPALAWSSDGKRLLVTGPAMDTFSVWNVGAAASE